VPFGALGFAKAAYKMFMKSTPRLGTEMHFLETKLNDVKQRNKMILPRRQKGHPIDILNFSRQSRYRKICRIL